MALYAHSKEGAGEEDWQTLLDHLMQVAETARGFAEEFHAGEWGYAAGLRHDRGKATVEYQRRLYGGPKVDHSTAGAQEIAGELELGKLLAACITGHHGGLADGISADGSCLEVRLKKKLPELLEIVGLPCVQVSRRLLPPFKLGRETAGFQLAFFTRMIFSCLVDADFLDTERFLDPERASWREGVPGIADLCRRFTEKIQSDERFTNPEPTRINLYRGEILRACVEKAEQPPGLFSLTVPTGGGKTISSLAFALQHARRHDLRRIIYVIPFTSIIEQNSEVFRSFLGQDAVVEHHSAFDCEERFPNGSEDHEFARRLELSSENWDASVIVTTGVQFFESLFASKPSRCRKLHNLARSVIILDEAQMLPVPFLAPCVQAIQELAANYGASIVLCTATQPSLQETDDFRMGLHSPVREIVEDPERLYEAFRRVRIEDAATVGLPELTALMKDNAQVLCIVNTRREACDLFDTIAGEEGAYHLSALMCPEHRSRKLEEIKGRLKDGKTCRLVSTRLIEAGVDIDFPVVLRAIAGIDSIAQAAGRCNREGKLEDPGRVIVYRLEGRRLPLDFRPPAECASEIMLKHPEDPLSLDAVGDYFRLLYWKYGDQLDREQVLSRFHEAYRELYFPFRSVDRDFEIIKDAGEPLIIPFDENGRGLIRALKHASFHGRILRRCQRYIVQVPLWQMKRLTEAHAVERIDEFYAVLKEDYLETVYSPETGLSFGDQTMKEEACYIV